ncbi:MAG: DUF839 domain-containing protein [Acidobacteria bacterium]|nr:DUF839 domain-containing protein [Acidobacteriota bacterium]
MYIKLNLGRLVTFVIPLIVLPVIATADFLTPQPPAITLDPGVPAGSSVLAILSSGEMINGFTFQGIPDGIGLAPANSGSGVDVFVNHEETTVPFFGSSDFQDASVSRVTLNLSTGAVTAASVALPASEGYLRFCSASMAGPAEGLDNYIFFTGEETNDIVDVAAGATTYGSDPSIAPQRQGGYAVILDPASGAFTAVPGLGRMNHENTIVVPGGWSQIAVLTTDDTFNAPSAQLYLYLANSESHIWTDQGSLWAFQVTRTDDGSVDQTDPFNGANDYLDIQPGDDFQGKFIRVPKQVATGQTGDAPQDALEQWSNDNNVFQFIRLEDLAYDKNDPRVVYIADTGRSRIVPDPATGRLTRGPSGTVGHADNGRIFKMVFNAKNPRKVDSLTVLADGDAPGTPEFVAMVNPDNMDTSLNSLMVQEDTRDAKIWQHDFATGTWSVAATVNDPRGESSGIVDASDWFGAGSWILDVQAHGSNFAEEVDSEGVLRKLEDGQLLLMTIPGS